MAERTIEQVLDEIRKLDERIPELTRARNNAASELSSAQTKRSNLTIELTKLAVDAKLLDYRHSALLKEVQSAKGVEA